MGFYEGHGLRLEHRDGDAGDHSVLVELMERDVYEIDKHTPAPGSVVVDIGAHVGAFARLIAARSPGTRVFAYELDAANFSLLARNAASEPRITATHAAVVGDEAPVGYRRHAHSSGCHVLAWDHDASGTVVDADGEVLPLPATTTLAQIAATHDLRSIDLLKIDVEGAEYEILEAARRDGMLDRVAMICGEYHYYFGRGLEQLEAILSPTFTLEIRSGGTFFAYRR